MTEIKLADLTTGKIDGSGVFDELMKAVQVRLDAEYSKSTIRGAEYSKVYLGAMESAMAQSISFLLSREKAGNEADLILEQILLAKENTLMTVAQKLVRTPLTSRPTS